MAKNTVIVSVLADTKGLKNGFKDVSSVLGGLGKVGKTALKTVTGIVTAIVGLAAAGGFKRALQLDEARTQLDALGYSGKQVDGIMGSALASVKGTAFGLGDAATIAANALASGKKEGDGLTKALTLVANTAALAKTDMGDMGAVFQKVWANNKVTTQEMNQLADRGVPIWQYLSEAFGVSNAELSKMIRNGEVTADMFESALAPAVDGMATKMSGSFKGMAANAMAALGRVGALFAGPILESGKNLLGVLTGLTDQIGEALTPVAERFGKILEGIDWERVVDRVVELAKQGVQLVTTFSPGLILFSALKPILPQLATAVGDLGKALGGALLAAMPAIVELLTAMAEVVAILAPLVADLVTWVASVVTEIIKWSTANGDIVGPLAAAAAAVVVVVAAIKTWRTILLGHAAASYGSAAATYANTAAAKLGAAAYALQNSSLGKLIASLRVNEALSLRTKIAIVASTVATNAAAVANKALNVVLRANPIGLIITAIAALVAGLVWFFTKTETGKKIWAAFTKFLGEAWENVTGWITDTLATLGAVFTDAWASITEGITNAWNAIVAFLTPIFEVIATIVRVYIEIWINVFIVLAAVLKTIWDGIVAVVMWVWNGIVAFLTPIITWISTFISKTMTAIRAAWDVVWNAIKGAFLVVWNAIKGALTPVLNAISTGISSAVNSIRAVWEIAWGAVKTFFTTIWNGIVNAVKDAIGRVVGVMKTVKDKVMAPIKGIGTWLNGAGGDLIRGLWAGITSVGDWIKNKITGFFDGIIGWAKDTLGIASPSKVFKGIGDFLGQGLAQGITGSARTVSRAVDGLASLVTDGFDASLTVPTMEFAGATGHASARTGGNVYNIYLDSLTPTAETGRAIVQAIRDYEDAGGRA